MCFKSNKAWQCKTLFSNWISQVCLCHDDDLSRWADSACQQSFEVTTTPTVFILLYHWSLCLGSLSNDDRTDDVWEYAAECVSGEFVTRASLLVWQPSSARRKLKTETLHTHSWLGSWQIPRCGVSTGLFLGVDVGAFDSYLQFGYKKTGRATTLSKSHRC